MNNFQLHIHFTIRIYDHISKFNSTKLSTFINISIVGKFEHKILINELIEIPNNFISIRHFLLRRHTNIHRKSSQFALYFIYVSSSFSVYFFLLKFSQYMAINTNITSVSCTDSFSLCIIKQK